MFWIINSWSKKQKNTFFLLECMVGKEIQVFLKKIFFLNGLFKLLLNEHKISRLDFEISMKDSMNLGFFLQVIIWFFFLGYYLSINFLNFQFPCVFCNQKRSYILDDDELFYLMIFCCIFASHSAYYKWLYWILHDSANVFRLISSFSILGFSRFCM